MPEKERTELAVDLGRAVAEMRNHINYLLQEKITQHAPHISFEMVEILACLWKEDGVNHSVRFFGYETCAIRFGLFVVPPPSPKVSEPL